jgi:hypothetical protein
MTSNVIGRNSSPAAFWPALALTLGALGVVATSFFYLLSPPEIVLPVDPINLARATDGAIRGAATLHLAGLIGILSDAILASAALTLAMQAEGTAPTGSRRLGWTLLATGTLIFIGVDANLGFVLPVLAARGAADFLGFKLCVDTLFALGTFTFGLGGALLLLPYVFARDRGIDAPAVWAALLFAVVALFAGLGALLGIDLHNLVGLGVSGSAVAFVFVGLSLLRQARA